MAKDNCGIYGVDDNAFAERIASDSLNPSKSAFKLSDSPTAGTGEAKGNLSDAAQVPNSDTTKVVNTRLGIGGAGTKSRGS